MPATNKQNESIQASKRPPLRPLLRWAGSKRRLLAALESQMPKAFGRYIEPFAGSAALYFSSRPRQAIVSDLNPELFNFYRQLKKEPALLHEQASKLKSNESNYLRIRNKFNSESDGFKRAVFFWYLNRNCFNGLYRTNMDGIFNVPFGDRLSVFPSLDATLACSRQLKSASVKQGDYEEIIDLADKGDFLYVDPPYKRFSNRSRGEYGPGAMEDSDLGRLVTAVLRASTRGVRILISYNDDIRDLLPGWTGRSINTRYSISANPTMRTPVVEYFFRNYELSA